MLEWDVVSKNGKGAVLFRMQGKAIRSEHSKKVQQTHKSGS